LPKKKERVLILKEIVCFKIKTLAKKEGKSKS